MKLFSSLKAFVHNERALLVDFFGYKDGCKCNDSVMRVGKPQIIKTLSDVSIGVFGKRLSLTIVVEYIVVHTGVVFV